MENTSDAKPEAIVGPQSVTLKAHDKITLRVPHRIRSGSKFSDANGRDYSYVFECFSSNPAIVTIEQVRQSHNSVEIIAASVGGIGSATLSVENQFERFFAQIDIQVVPPISPNFRLEIGDSEPQCGRGYRL